jgi:signal transduction histidine kinase
MKLGDRIPLGAKAATARAVRERRVIHVPDIEHASEEEFGDTKARAAAQGFRALLAVPLMREGAAVGVIFIRRTQAVPFSDEHIALLRTFADQAAIAIENVRLFKELEARNKDLGESLERQTATSEILKVISSTPTDEQPVFDAIVQSAARLFNRRARIRLVDGDGLRLRARSTGAEGEAVIPIDRDAAAGRAVLDRRPVQFTDVQTEDTPESFRRRSRLTGYRAIATAPLLREGRAIGVISISSPEPGTLDEKQMALLQTFADQAVIAIENVRLFREIQEKSRQLEEASQHKSQFLASMSHELRTPLNAILGFNEMILGQVYGEVPQDMHEPLKDIQTSGKHLLRLINNVLDLAKIEAGRMELALADYSVQDMVESVRSTLRPLAAEKGLEFLARVPADIPPAHGDGGRLTQCLLNLAGNSLKFTKSGRVEIGVAQESGRIRFHVADTGIGIPAEKIASLFTEFKQTDATIASEYGGTGLGLSITKKFIEMHGGRIWVESEPGKGSTFLFEVPLRVSA